MAQAVSQREGLLRGMPVCPCSVPMHKMLKATAFTRANSGVFWFGYLWRIIVFWEKNWGKSKDFGGRGKGKNLSRGRRKSQVRGCGLPWIEQLKVLEQMKDDGSGCCKVCCL